MAAAEVAPLAGSDVGFGIVADASTLLPVLMLLLVETSLGFTAAIFLFCRHFFASRFVAYDNVIGKCASIHPWQPCLFLYFRRRFRFLVGANIFF